MDSEAENYYELLGINSNSSMEEIRDRYRYLVRVFHPDRFTTEKDKIQAENDLTKINVAYSVLSDPERRKKYDQDIDSRKKTGSQADEPLHPDDPQTGDIIEYIRSTQLKWGNKWELTPNNNELSMLLSDTFKIYFLLYDGAYPFDNQSKRDEKFKEFQGILYYVISSGVALGLEKKKNGIPKTIQEEKLIFVNAMLLYSYLSNIAEIVSNNLLFETTSNTLIPVSLTTVTPGRLRADNAAKSLSFSTTTNTFVSTLRFFNTFANSFVFGASKFNVSTTIKSPSATFVERTDLIAKRRTFLFNL